MPAIQASDISCREVHIPGLSGDQSSPGTPELLEAQLLFGLQEVDSVPSCLAAALKQETEPKNKAELEVTCLLLLLLDNAEPNRSHLAGIMHIMHNSRI